MIALREQQRGCASPWVRADAQWKLDNDDESVFESNTRGTRSPGLHSQRKLHSLQAVHGAGVIGQHHHGALTLPDTGNDVDSGPAAPINPDTAVRQLVESRDEQQERQQLHTTRLATQQQPHTSARESISSRSPAVAHSPKAQALRAPIDLDGTQHPRAATSAGLAESRRSTVRHIDDILHHPSRTPRQPDKRGLIPDERSRASLVSSTQRLAAARLRQEGVYVTGLVQSVRAPSVFCRDQYPRSTGDTKRHVSSASGENEAHNPRSSLVQQTQQQRQEQRMQQNRTAVGPFEDGAFHCHFSYNCIGQAACVWAADTGADALPSTGSFAYARPWTANSVDIGHPSQLTNHQDSPTTQNYSTKDGEQQINGPSGWAPTRRPTSRGTSPGGARPYGYINADLGRHGNQEQHPPRGVVPPPLAQPRLVS